MDWLESRYSPPFTVSEVTLSRVQGLAIRRPFCRYCSMFWTFWNWWYRWEVIGVDRTVSLHVSSTTYNIVLSAPRLAKFFVWAYFYFFENVNVFVRKILLGNLCHNLWPTITILWLNFRVYKSEDRGEATLTFNNIRHRLHLLASASDILDKEVVQKLFNAVDLHPTFECAHVACFLGLSDLLSNANVAMWVTIYYFLDVYSTPSIILFLECVEYVIVEKTNFKVIFT